VSSLQINVIGDSGPFSELGKSIGYQLKHQNSNYLLDCGAPVFQLLGESGLIDLDGIIATHAHEDHKRWFTDLALYCKFSPEMDERLHLIGTHRVIENFRLASQAALERTLNPQSNDIRSYSFEDFIKTTYIGPEPKYSVKKLHDGDGNYRWRVVDRDNNPIEPTRAKVVKPKSSLMPTMIFKDPADDIWVEPATYYSFNDDRFYDLSTESNAFELNEDFYITPYKAPAWHGPETNSYVFTVKEEGEVFFSSDTVYNPGLWETLTETRESKLSGTNQAFQDSLFIEDRIENLTEQIWSEKRLDRAKSLYEKDRVYIHDVSGPNPIVHTAYEHLEDFQGSLLLTHSPDEFVTKHPMAHLGKTYVLRNNELLERTKDGSQLPLQATCYVKKYSDYYVGFENPEGDYLFVQKSKGHYEITDDADSLDETDEVITRISLFRDIGGEYYPLLVNENTSYRLRDDGRVERLEDQENGSKGEIVEGKRHRLIDKTAS
jgi:ribonuclease BN (tRNA processing enzyme)